jgi:hypothetical protein
MPILYVNTGSAANKGDGDSLRVAFSKINQNFDEVLAAISTSTGTIGSGYTGSQGIMGYTGSIGIQGYTGSMGIQGYTGSIGGQGDLGYTGSIGFTGSIGGQGFTGSNGYTGSIGAQGPQGLIGPQGPSGSLGAQGPQGPQGMMGYTGSAGSSLSTTSTILIQNNTSTATLSYYQGTQTNDLSVIMAVNDSSSPYIISTNSGTNAWTFSPQGTLSVPLYNYTGKSVSGTIDTVLGDPYATYGSTSTSETTVYTASSEDIVGLKMTLRIQYLAHVELVEISAVKPFDNSIVDYLVYGSVKSDSTADDTIIAVNLDQNNHLRVQAQSPFDAYYTYTVTEYHKTDNTTIRS